ncbi:hypothetical protein FQN57_000147 [Myotisia sp. PD_48]|nr:hypothetical protein FQN57_000147 [Myotisia sp. PD_48]
MSHVPKRRKLPWNPPRPRTSATETTSKSIHVERSISPPSAVRKPRSYSDTDSTSSTPPDSPPAKKAKKAKPASKILVPASRSPSPIIVPSSSSEQRNDSPPAQDSLSSEPEFILAEITAADGLETQREDPTTSEPLINPKLVTTLLHHHFQDKKTRITKDANKVFGKYVDIFIREAIARAVFERKEMLTTDGVQRSRVQTALDSYLEVEDLEKLAPQLLLDF